MPKVGGGLKPVLSGRVNFGHVKIFEHVGVDELPEFKNPVVNVHQLLAFVGKKDAFHVFGTWWAGCPI